MTRVVTIAVGSRHPVVGGDFRTPPRHKGRPFPKAGLSPPMAKGHGWAAIGALLGWLQSGESQDIAAPTPYPRSGAGRTEVRAVHHYSGVKSHTETYPTAYRRV